ncbi:DUF1697 domain-containing protein [Brevibacillus brevis]|uniref:DUF1697 domain-containing protein n=1 Tax=Brevibacillus brevis TaxID=1393 RepID=A0ABY9T458_BREBE|nr:DUF1697 domain-containing protein [Brevibacillus brevis]WNC14786.1 DUF1697 domain-containing protein [Brevibacillus brevis]
MANSKTVYIALLRGINVGGKNKIKMAELRSALENIGLFRVKTYIQSGNVLFVSEDDEDTLRKRMEEEIASSFGITLTVVLRTAEELQRIVENCPFSDELIEEAAASAVGESLYVALLPEAPPPSGVDKLAAAENGNDLYEIAGRDVYLLFRQSVRDAKLSANLAKLGVPATVRNWNTMSKLAAMTREMEA